MNERLRYALGLIITLAVILIIMLIYACVPDDQSQAATITSKVPELGPSKWDDHMIELDKQTLERAYQAQVQLLFTTWLRDDITATHRIENGLRIARRAYIHAANELEKRAAEVAARAPKQ